MKTIAIILSGGKGSRFSSEMPKQFLCIAGKPLIHHTIAKFHSMQEIDEIIIVSHKDFIEDVKKIVLQAEFDKVKCIIEGGKERKDSTYNALKILDDEKNAKVLIHDAVRPLVAQSVIKECITALDSHPACAVARLATDTIFEVSENKIVNIPKRNRMYQAQTPQGFQLSLIKEAYNKLMQEKEPPAFSDDCGVFLHSLHTADIAIIQGNRENIKLTYPEDEIYIRSRIFLQ